MQQQQQQQQQQQKAPQAFYLCVLYKKKAYWHI